MNKELFIEKLSDFDKDFINPKILKKDKRLILHKSIKQQCLLLEGHHLIPTGFELIPYYTVTITIQWIIKNIGLNRKGFRIKEQILFLNIDNLLFLTKDEHTKLHKFLDNKKLELYKSIDYINYKEYNQLAFLLNRNKFIKYYANNRNWKLDKKNMKKTASINYRTKKYYKKLNRNKLELQSLLNINNRLEYITTLNKNNNLTYIWSLLNNKKLRLELNGEDSKMKYYRFIISNYYTNHTKLITTYQKYLTTINSKKLTKIIYNNNRFLGKYKEDSTIFHKKNLINNFNKNNILIGIDSQGRILIGGELLAFYIDNIELLPDIEYKILYFNGDNLKNASINNLYNNLKDGIDIIT